MALLGLSGGLDSALSTCARSLGIPAACCGGGSAEAGGDAEEGDAQVAAVRHEGPLGKSLQASRAAGQGDYSIAAEALALLQCPGAKVQVCADGVWEDMTEAETRHIRAHLASESSIFSAAAPGAKLAIDFSSSHPVQRNLSTGTQRDLRIWAPAAAAGLDSRVLPARPRNAATPRLSRQGSMKHLQQSRWWLEAQAARAADEEGGYNPATATFEEEGDLGDDDEYEEMIEEQEVLGPQSRRGCAPQDQITVLDQNPHARACFRLLEDNEAKYCGEWAAFYHAYSLAALIYEVQAAIACSVFGFSSQSSTLPRILVHEFARFPDSASLLDRFHREYAHGKKDHDREYRRVAISAMCSLVALGPEASTPVVFLAGYSERDVSFKGVLENLLESCYVPRRKIGKLAADVIALSEKHGLDVSQFGGRPCESGKAGHLLQIFIRRDLVDMLAYASRPFGVLDKSRHPISGWLNADTNTNFGQARIVAHPLWFMQPDCVQMRVVSADPHFHHSRQQFQGELTTLLGDVLGDPVLHESAARGIFGGEVPSWFEWQSSERTPRQTPR